LRFDPRPACASQVVRRRVQRPFPEAVDELPRESRLPDLSRPDEDLEEARRAFQSPEEFMEVFSLEEISSTAGVATLMEQSAHGVEQSQRLEQGAPDADPRAEPAAGLGGSSEPDREFR
jgi:hypothetical protein